MEQIFIRPMTKDDLHKVVETEKLCFADPWSEQSFVEGMNNEYQKYFVALSDNDIVGYVALFHIFEEGEILNIATKPTQRKKGIASKLLEYSFEFLKGLGVTRVTLEVRKSNTNAQSLYTKYGFNPISVRRNYYTFPLEDGIVMEKTI